MAAFSLSFRSGPSWVYQRYWLASCVRASFYAVPNIHQLALSAVAGDWHDYAVCPSTNGAALPRWFLARSGPRKVLVALAGTMLPITYFSHLTGGLGMVTGPWPGKVHAFWAGNSAALAAQIAAALGPIDKPSWHLTGHSWGGACAQALAYSLRSLYPDTGTVEVLTFGCPKVGNATFAEGFQAQPYLWQDVNPFDPVPWLPPAFNAFLVGALGGGALQALAVYRHGGVQHRWVKGLGPPPPVAGGVGPFTSSVQALGALTKGYQSLRPHLGFYYALKWYLDSRLGRTFAASAADALALGYDLDTLDTASASINALDGLPAVWPLPGPQEP